MKGKVMRGKASRARLFGFLIAGFIFSFALFQANPASANVARSMSNAELDTVYAGSSIRFNWRAQIKFAHSNGFKFNFSAGGSIRQRGGSHHDGGFRGEVALLGGLFKVDAGSGDLPSSSGTVVSTVSGPTSSGNPGSSVVSFSVDKTNDPGSGNVQVSFGGGDTSGGQSVVSFNGANVDSNIGVDISVIKSSFSANGVGSRIRAITTRTVRRALCLGCP